MYSRLFPRPFDWTFSPTASAARESFVANAAPANALFYRFTYNDRPLSLYSQVRAGLEIELVVLDEPLEATFSTASPHQTLDGCRRWLTGSLVQGQSLWSSFSRAYTEALGYPPSRVYFHFGRDTRNLIDPDKAFDQLPRFARRETDNVCVDVVVTSASDRIEKLLADAPDRTMVSGRGGEMLSKGRETGKRAHVFCFFAVQLRPRLSPPLWSSCWHWASWPHWAAAQRQ